MTHRKSKNPASGSAAPKAVVSRLSLYLRELQHLVDQRQETISSGELGQRLGLGDAQVRKDLAFFGQFGYPGVGYRCSELIDEIRKIVGTDRVWPVAIVGIGNLGRALIGYKGFVRQGFEMVAALDADPNQTGVAVDHLVIEDVGRLAEIVKERGVRVGLIAVPATAAQAVADQLVAAGVEGIVNFAPVTISLPDHVAHVGVDLAIELEQISFAVVNRPASE